MNPEAFAELNTVPLQNAVFCVNCEIISDSPHDVCAVCGSRSLIGLVRILGGTLWSRPRRTGKAPANKVRYNLELTVKAFEVAARDLNHAIDSITHLADVGGDLESVHLNIESVNENAAQGFLKAA
jgi:hypothetical protein